MKIKSMSLGELGTNCHIVYDDKNALIFDPGGEAHKIIKFLEDENLEPLGIFLTHAHFDHIGGVDELRKYYNIDVYLHKEEAHWLEQPSLNRSTAFMRKEVKTSPPDHLLNPGELNIGPFTFKVIHTPGHSPGSVTFIFKQYRFVISGDVLFNKGVGRTDLPGGSMEQLVHSLQKKLYMLADDYVVYPGHGTTTTIGEEKKLNPFVPGE